jgi:hypothetical protein
VVAIIWHQACYKYWKQRGVVRKESTDHRINMIDVNYGSKSYAHMETFINDLATNIDIR